MIEQGQKLVSKGASNQILIKPVTATTTKTPRTTTRRRDVAKPTTQSFVSNQVLVKSVTTTTITTSTTSPTTTPTTQVSVFLVAFVPEFWCHECLEEFELLKNVLDFPCTL